MKYILIIIVCVISFNCTAQKYILLDRGWERPAFYTDSITKQMKEGFLPFYKDEFDSLCTIVAPLKDIGKLGMKRVYLNSDDFTTQHVNFKITNVQGAYGDKYDIDIISKTEAGNLSMRLSNSQLDDYKNKFLMHNFIRYLEKTKKEIILNKVKAK